jgi:hypothetical protein
MTDTTQATTKKHKAVAKHELLDHTGAVIEDLAEENAHGMRYTLLGNKEFMDYMYGKSPEKDRMLAVFGAKTLATNETSQARNGKLAAGHAEQIKAVRDRFDLLETGKWVDRTREGGFAINIAAAATAAVQVLLAEGKITADGVDAATAERVAKLETDEAYRATIRKGVSGGHTALTDAYAKIVGKATVSVDDL